MLVTTKNSLNFFLLRKEKKIIENENKNKQKRRLLYTNNGVFLKDQLK